MRALLCILLLLFCELFGCASGRQLPELEMSMPRTVTERCSGNKALGCYSTGLSLAETAGTGEPRHEAVSLISEACAAGIESACQTLNNRLKPPRRIAGRAADYTSEARWVRMQGKLLVKCILTEEGVLKDCKVEPPASEEERKLIAESNIEKEILAALATWRFTPALFDDRPFPFDFVWELNLRPPQRRRR